MPEVACAVRNRLRAVAVLVCRVAPRQLRRRHDRLSRDGFVFGHVRAGAERLEARGARGRGRGNGFDDGGVLGEE
ncbi:hypothetical protein ACFPRL_14770 [Pseudoclavibacter helvolus]